MAYLIAAMLIALWACSPIIYRHRKRRLIVLAVIVGLGLYGWRRVISSPTRGRC